MPEYRQSFSRGEVQEPVVWERVVWRQGDGRYIFEIAEGGLHATLRSPHDAALTLPVVAWEGLLDALSAARKTRTRSERGFPVRSGARWYEGEIDELVVAFKAGRTIPQLARAHNRSELAVEAQLDRLRLWDRVARQPVVQVQARGASPGTSDAPLDGWGARPGPIPLGEDRD